MPKRARKVRGALLGAAATALAVEQTLASPAGVIAKPGLDQLKHRLDQKGRTAIGQSQVLIDRAQARLVGTVLRVPPTPPAGSRPATVSGAPRQPDRPPTEAQIRGILRAAAIRHGIDPKLVLALSYWESGWDQSLVSSTGAVGLMQVEPATAQEAGPALLGRAVDITDPPDNADVGAAVLKQDLDAFRDPAMALAAYYQGATSLRAYGMFPDTQQYVDGILNLASRM